LQVAAEFLFGQFDLVVQLLVTGLQVGHLKLVLLDYVLQLCDFLLDLLTLLDLLIDHFLQSDDLLVLVVGSFQGLGVQLFL